MNTKKIILLSCLASSMSGTAHCASCIVEDAPALHKGVKLPADAQGIVHQNVSEQDVQQFRNLVQDLCTSYNATRNDKQLHRNDVLAKKTPPKMPIQQDQRVLEEPMRSLAPLCQYIPNADIPMPFVAQKSDNLMDKQEDTQTRSVQSSSAQQSDVAMKMEKFLTTVKKEQKSADDHRFIQEVVGSLHCLAKKAKNITGTDQEKITNLVSRLGKKYTWNKDDQNKATSESGRQAHVSPVNTRACPDAVTSSVPSLSSSSNDITSHTQSTPEMAPVVTHKKDQSDDTHQARSVKNRNTLCDTNTKMSYIAYTHQSNGTHTQWTLDDNGHVTHGKGAHPAFEDLSWNLFTLDAFDVCPTWDVFDFYTLVPCAFMTPMPQVVLYL